MNKTVRNLVFWVVIVMSAFLLWQVVRAGPGPDLREISYSDFLSRAESGNVAEVTISRNEILGQAQDGSRFRLVPPPSMEGTLRLLHDKNVEIWFRDTPNEGWPIQLLGAWAPLILLAVLWFFMTRTLWGRQARPPSTDP